MTQAHFKIATIALSSVALALLVLTVLSRQPASQNGRSPDDPTLQAGSFAVSGGNDESRVSVVASGSQLRVGVIGATPERSELRTITQLPVSQGEVSYAVSDARSTACRLRTQGSPVQTNVGIAGVGKAGSLGRVTVLTLALELDQEGRDRLPSLTRAEVIKYFDKHRLSIQVDLHYDEDHAVYFGTQTQAAFYDVNDPAVTVNPEPMIEAAMKRFRVLGVVGAPEPTGLSAEDLGRTLALSFEFAKKDRTVTGVGGGIATTTELLLLHLLPGATADDYTIEVFVTDDERRKLHLIGEITGSGSVPELRSSIRFDKLVLLGMYPADPVVTSASYTSLGALSMAAFNGLVRGGDSGPMSVTEALDRFASLSQSESRPGSDLIEDEVAEAAARKARELQRMLDSAKPRAKATVLGK